MISFDSKNVAMPDIDIEKVSTWLEMVAESHSCRIGNLCYLFCNDDEILDVNRRFLNHDYFTDIITFDYSRKDKVSGDIFISLDTVKSNSVDLKTSYNTELLRVIVHGLLHLCGINDKSPEERIVMERNEDQALEMLKNLKR